MLDNMVYLRQSFDNATDVLPVVDAEPSLPGPETLLAQFNHRYTAALSPVQPQVHMCTLGSDHTPSDAGSV